MTDSAAESSFRDPSGFLFRHDGVLYRQVNRRYEAHYERLMQSGLYQALTDKELLVRHQEADAGLKRSEEACRVLRPEPLPFISYPYEWSFSQLRTAALTTLKVHKLALEHEMVLKDCSAYNVQFVGWRPVFIDTLSFESYRPGQPWVGYRQFCQHFLAPLALMSYRDVRLGQLLRIHIDGVPLDLAAELLPARTKLRLALLMHIHLHAAGQKRYADKAVKPTGRTVSRAGLLGLVDSLESVIRRLRWRAEGTEWADYYEQTNYTDRARDHKAELVARFLQQADPKMVWDLGANTGLYSRLASQRGAFTVAFDIDPAAVERNYQQARADKDLRLLPLLVDLTNPSAGTGWANRERMSLAERGPADVVLALALIHHLAVSNNVPFEKIAGYLASLGRRLIIEFVPKSDSQVQKLLASREDIFDRYTRADFERAFGGPFAVEQAVDIGDSRRTLYLMRRR